MLKQERYASNDIIAKAPPVFWWQGFLLGNGSAAATLWNPAQELLFQLGDTDLLDKAIEPGDDRCSIPNTRHALRGAIRVHSIPLFDSFYLKEYNARTSLATGILETVGTSEFGTFSFSSFYSREPDVFLLRYSDTTTEKVVRSVNLEKLGSRFFSRIWTGTDPDTSKGIGTVTIWVAPATQQPCVGAGEVVEITYQTGEFCMAAAVSFACSTPHTDVMGTHAMERTFAPSDAFALELRVAVQTGETPAAALQKASAALASAAQTNFSQLATSHAAAREAQLPDTYVALPQDVYYEALWYTSRYHMRSCYKGKYPAFFINGPFGGDRDKREWADCWLHWNLHASHQGIVKSGDWDLFEAYADYKMRQIPSAKELARKEYGCGGIVTQDQQKPDGGNRGISGDYYKLSIFPCLQTSLQFFKYWKFTNDADFLQSRLAPYLHLTLEFWRDYLVADEAGVLHVPRSHPYEFHNGYGFRDCLVDLSLLRACLSAYGQVYAALSASCAAASISSETQVESAKLDAWCKTAAQTLADFTQLPVLKDYVTAERGGARVYDNPFFAGEPYSETDTVLAIGFSERNHCYVTNSHTHREITEPDVAAHGGYGAFCSSQSSFVFPAGLIDSDAAPEWRQKRGASREQTALWENGRNALRCIRRFPPNGQVPRYPIAHQDTLSWTGHSLELPAFAKLGLTEPLRKAMEFYTQHYQMFPQGMFNYHPRARWMLDYGNSTLPTGEERRVDFLPFCQHFSFEELGIFTETVDTMLMDSANGLLRLFPAYSRDAAFLLPAEGGFTVEAVQLGGAVRGVKIHSRFGGVCRVRLAWDACFLTQADKTVPLILSFAVAAFDTEADKTYFLSPDAATHTLPELPGHTAQPRRNGDMTLGIFRRF